MPETTPANRTIVVLPLRDLVVFPYMVVPLFVGRDRSLEAISAAQRTTPHEILAITQKNSTLDDPTADDLFDVGTVAQILQVFQMPDGVMKVLVEGSYRAKVNRYITKDTYLEAEIEAMVDSDENHPRIQALMRSVVELFEQYVKNSRKIPSEILVVASSVESSSRLADIISANLNLKTNEKQDILAAGSAEERLEMLHGFIQREIEIFQVEKRISERVRKQMEQLQKEYFMREQLKAIQRELGDQDDSAVEIEEIRKRIAAAGMPEHAESKAYEELDRLSKIGPHSPESSVLRNYLEVICELPWSKSSPDNLDVKKAARTLERDHYGLKEPKERILEYLAVLRLKKVIKGPILCFVGPPGVGKTSLAQSIADAMGRKFVRMSLGGVRDEAEIRGHRKTYVGAMPGRILQLLRRCGTHNPVMLLDEIDKTGKDWRGDVSSALLEVLDPEQNTTFQDHYLGIPFDLSKVLFICTANVPHSIPGPLRDRMETIHLPGYTEQEKLQIAQRHLLPKQAKENGLGPKQVSFTTEVLQTIINNYTKEAGIRDFERQINKVMRRIAKDLVAKKRRRDTYRVDNKGLEKYLGIPKYQDLSGEMDEEPGVATGLAWTPYGGQPMPMEAVVMPGNGAIMATGSLGQVMQESVEAAISHLKARADDFGLEPEFHKHQDIHVHAPEGAIPKDGPASGVTIAVAVVSALSGRPVRREVAMTGELTLQGKILPVEGIKEKALAAFRIGVKEVILPKENQKDLEEIPKEIRDGLIFHQVATLAEALKHALQPA